MSKYEVISFGSAVLDTFVYTNIEDRGKNISLPVGTKILVDKIKFMTGGGGTNSAFCFSKLGLKTAYLGKLGSECNTEMIIEDLAKNKVDFIGKISNYPNGYSIIIEGKNKVRTILSFKGASAHMKFSEINLLKIDCKILYLTSLEGESFESQKKLADYANKKGIFVCFNPSSYQTKKGVGFIKDILRKTDFLTLNKEEAKMLVSGSNLIKKLSSLGPKIVSITDGKNGVEVYDGKYFYKYKPEKVKVVETRGAGDVFGSTFATGLYLFKDTEMALKCAISNVESFISEENDEGLLNFNEIKLKIKEGNFGIKRYDVG